MNPRLMAVADAQLRQFPPAMERLVAAGIFDAKGELVLTTRNRYVVPGTGRNFDYIHAEEGLLAKLAKGGLPPGPYELVVSLEPCDDDRNDGEEACAPRIAGLAKDLGITRVLAGCLDDGLGVPILARAGLEVEVMIGAKLEGPEGWNRAPRVLTNLQAAVAAEPWGVRVKLTTVADPDPVTAASQDRLRRRNEREAAEAEAVLAWIEARRPTAAEVIAAFPMYFELARDSAWMSAHLAALASDSVRGRGPLLRQVRSRCYPTLNRQRDVGIMEFERGSAS